MRSCRRRKTSTAPWRSWRRIEGAGCPSSDLIPRKWVPQVSLLRPGFRPAPTLPAPPGLGLGSIDANGAGSLSTGGRLSFRHLQLLSKTTASRVCGRVYTPDKSSEKIQYMHRNPVKRGLVAGPGEWPWSSYGHYASGERFTVQIESEWTAARRNRAAAKTHVSEARHGAPNSEEGE